MRTKQTAGRGYGASWSRIIGIVAVLLVAGSANASYVTISSPTNGASVSGAVSINAAIGSGTVWINVYVDGHYLASGPPYSFSWNSANVPNGTHTITAKAYSSPGVVLGSSAVNVNVANGSTTGSGGSYVTITSPANGASLAGTVPINASIGSGTVWINVDVDGHYLASGPPYSFSWNSSNVANGNHTITAKAYSSPGVMLGTSSVGISVANGSTTTSNGYFFAMSGSDSNPCTQTAPCKSLARAQDLLKNATPGQAVVFQRGGIWYGGITMPHYLSGSSGNPITIGNYGSGPLPIIDGGGSAPACIYASAWSGGSTPLWSYITIDGLECRNTTQYGVVFSQQAGGTAGMPGIVVKNMNIHNTGPSYDDGNYRNQLMFKDENKMYDGVQFLNNSVTSCGGHNCIQVQEDIGHPLIAGNYCAGWHHNCIDVKSVVGAIVKDNIVNGNSALGGAAYYLENTQIPAADVTWERNIVYGPVDGFECEWGGAGSGVSSTCRIYNNTAYLGNPSAVVTGGGSSCGNVRLDVRNNVFDTAFTFYNGHSCMTPTWDYNDDGGTHTGAKGPVGPHDLQGANPMYVNAGAQDFHLRSGSPCIGAGLSGLPSGLNNMGAW